MLTINRTNWTAKDNFSMRATVSERYHGQFESLSQPSVYDLKLQFTNPPAKLIRQILKCKTFKIVYHYGNIQQVHTQYERASHVRNDDTLIAHFEPTESTRVFVLAKCKPNKRHRAPRPCAIQLRSVGVKAA